MVTQKNYLVYIYLCLLAMFGPTYYGIYLASRPFIQHDQASRSRDGLEHEQRRTEMPFRGFQTPPSVSKSVVLASVAHGDRRQRTYHMIRVSARMNDAISANIQNVAVALEEN